MNLSRSEMQQNRKGSQIKFWLIGSKTQAVILVLAMYLMRSGPSLAFF